MIQFLFFLIPFFMLGGTAWQGGSLYLCAMIVPTVLILRGKLRPNFDRWKSPLLLIGSSLLVMFLIFPFANFINFLTEPGSSVRMFVPQGSPPLRKLLNSQMSSAFLVSGLFLWVFAIFFSRSESTSGPEVNADMLLRRFHQGMLLASLILLSYGLFQHVTGIDFLSPTGRLSATRLLTSSGRFRTSGFFGHPLSLAGASLGIFSFYLMLCRGRFRPLQSVVHDRAGSVDQKYDVSVYVLVVIGFCHLSLIVLSGGRFATLVAVLLTGVFLLGEILARKSSGKSFVIIFAMIISGMIFIVQTGMTERFIEVWNQLRSGGPDRLKFWEVYWAMIEDKPWFGHGYAWMKYWSREIYYAVMGYEQLTHKYNAHNIYLEILSNVGIFGSGILLLSFFFSGLAFRYLMIFGGYRLAGSAIFVSVIANMINGITQNTFFDSNVVFIYLFLCWTFLWLSVLNSGRPSSPSPPARSKKNSPIKFNPNQS